MNSNHLATIVWVRWRLTRNQFAKSGRVGKILLLALLLLATLGSVGCFVLAAGWGKLIFARIDPAYLIYVWDALAALFLFGWAVSLMTELQRSELLSLRNLLHLPVSLSGAFFLNYASSLASLPVLIFLPAMLGLCLASCLHFGITSLVTFALLIAFVFMVTAVSYQLRGWLARLMENKRTRGTVVAVTTIVFVLIFQIPSMLNLGSRRWQSQAMEETRAQYSDQLNQLESRHEAGEIDGPEFEADSESAKEAFNKKRNEIRQAETRARNKSAHLLNALLPIGWLPYGASAAASGAILSPWLCVLGMSTIGTASLSLSYRSTLRVYTGDHTKRSQSEAPAKEESNEPATLLTRTLPLLSDTQSAIALASFQSLIRAPESKMALLTPLIFICVFGSMLFGGPFSELPRIARPWIGVGAVAMALFGMSQLMLNVFGLDRRGFQAYILMPAKRKDILLGKNLGTLPITLSLSALLVLFFGIAGGLQVSHTLATLLQILVAILIYLPICNFVSIVAPVGMAVGTMKPSTFKLSSFFLQFLAMFAAPFTVIPAALALSVDLLAGFFGIVPGFPFYLLLTLIELPIVAWLYLKVLVMQGDLLHDREQQILEAVTKVND